MPSDSFPWKRYQTAERYLYTVKPYWSRFGSRFNVVPMDVPAPPGEAFGAMTSTDETFNLYVDGAFARNAAIEVIAGAIEHEFRYHVQDYFGRMAFADRDRASEYKKLSFELEVNETIEAETKRITPAAINSALHNSMVFSHAEYRQLGIQGPPSISDLAWTPDRLGLEGGKTAEEYFNDLKRAMSRDEARSDGEQGEGPSEGEGDSGDGEGEDGSGEGSPQDDSDQDSESASSGEGASPSDSSSEGENDPDASEESTQASSSAGDEGPDLEASDDEVAPSSGGGDGEAQESEDPPGDEGGSDEGEGSDEDRPEGPESQEASTSDINMDDSDESPIDRIKDIIDDVPSMSWWTRDVDPEGFTDEDQEVNEEPPSEWEAREWLEELAEDVKEAQCSSTYGLEPGNALVELSDDILKASGGRYEELRRAISSSVNTSQIKGSSDMSYQVRNPNQPSLGVVLMGSFSYSPAISVILDVSMSMVPHLRISLIAMRDLIRSAVGMYGDQVNWLAVDSDVVDMGRASNVNMKLVNRLSKGFGGTVLGPTMVELANGTFRKGRNRLPRQDLIIVITDCKFKWPWKNSRPPSKTTFMVLHPKDEDLDRVNLPEWVHQRPHYLLPIPL